MKSFICFILLITLAVTTFAQKRPRPTKPRPKAPLKTALTPEVPVISEKEELEKAVALENAAERIAALQKFAADFPDSTEMTRALELTTSTRAALADEKLRAGERENALELFKLAVREAPNPISDKLFTEVVLQIPSSLFFRGERAAAIEVAKSIEEKTAGNAKQLLGLAGFYLTMENAADAKRLAEKAIALEPNLPAAYQTIGLAHRLDFELEESANAYAKALELDPNSNVSKRSLAEMKRAVGKASEAVALYREILANDAADAAAQTGLILALFDADNKTEAESELQKSLEANSNNLFLLTGAAYWYAAHEQGARAVELAEKAVAVEPRYTWARIALARGLMQQKRPLDAEKALLAARQYGDFPTLDYELAAARFQSGYYREAVESLQKKFAVKDNLIAANLGGRVARNAQSFTDLLAAERRASIFEPRAADNSETADKLKSLLEFSQKLDAASVEEIVAAADEFVKGEDRMKIHRQLFVADQLLEKRKALPKVLELSKSAISTVEIGLDAPNATSAILADELYQSRRIAMTRNELVLVPDVPRQTLSRILRGRIEDTAGWALYQEGKTDEAVVRLKRAVSVLPEKSAWWRDSMWRLGAAQDIAGNQKDALDAYIKSYTSGEASAVKYGIIETIYQKINGSTDGLEAKIGSKPAPIYSDIPAPTETKTNEQSKMAVQPVEPKPESSPSPSVTETNASTEEPNSAPKVSDAETQVKKQTTLETKPEIKPENSPVSETKTEILPPTETKIEPAPSPEIKVENSSVDETKPETKTTNEPTETTTEPTSKTEVKTQTAPVVEITTEKNLPSETKREESVNKSSETNSKSLFDPIVITVPKVEPIKKPTPETKNADENATETGTPRIGKKAVEDEQSKTSDENEAEPKKTSDPSFQSRPRVVKTENNVTISPCRILASEDALSILSNGGNLSLFVRFENESNAADIKATSSSPADIEVSPEPEMNNQSSRAFFVVKSISPKTGVFTIKFEAACGTKEIAVKVR